MKVEDLKNIKNVSPKLSTFESITAKRVKQILGKKL